VVEKIKTEKLMKAYYFGWESGGFNRVLASSLDEAIEKANLLGTKVALRPRTSTFIEVGRTGLAKIQSRRAGCCQ